MTFALQRPWSQDRFLAWAEAQEGRYEFDGTQPVAMTGGTLGHGVVLRNLHRVLDAGLRGKACRPLGPDAGIATVGSAIRYPDALVTCSAFDMAARIVPNPVIVFEILSSSTSRTDRLVKVREYAAVDSIRRYVILESTSVGMTVMERGGPDRAWQVTALTSGDILRLPEIGIEAALPVFYEDMVFEPG